MTFFLTWMSSINNTYISSHAWFLYRYLVVWPVPLHKFISIKKMLVLNLAACSKSHIHFATDESLEFEEIGSVNKSYQFTYLHGEEEDLWPGGLWGLGETLRCMHRIILYRCYDYSLLPCAWEIVNTLTSSSLTSRIWRCNSIWWCSLGAGCISTSFPHCHLLHPGYSRHHLCCGMPHVQLHVQEQEVRCSYWSIY